MVTLPPLPTAANILPVAVEYVNSKVARVIISDSLRSLSGFVTDQNAGNMSVGYEPSWSLYVIDGDYMFPVDTHSPSGVAYDVNTFTGRVETLTAVHFE